MPEILPKAANAGNTADSNEAISAVSSEFLPSAKHPKQAGAFFGRRKGRPLRQMQESLFADMLPRLAIDINAPAPQDLTQLFAAPQNFTSHSDKANFTVPSHKVDNMRLEIGFGGGEHLLHEAARCPQNGFIGAEPFINGMAKMLASLHDDPQKAGNIRLFPDDALKLLNWLPDSSLAEIDILYPDPWPKKKHWKRRFVNSDNIARFARILRKGGILRFASDIDSYVNQVLLLMRKQTAFVWQAEQANDWKTPYEGWIMTRYEAKAKRENRSTAYLTFIRQ